MRQLSFLLQLKKETPNITASRNINEGSGEGDPEGGHYVTTTVRVGRQMLPAIRSVKDDREVLGDIAKQLVIVGIPFRLVTVR
jgi:hypothetical protein